MLEVKLLHCPSSKVIEAAGPHISRQHQVLNLIGLDDLVTKPDANLNALLHLKASSYRHIVLLLSHIYV